MSFSLENCPSILKFDASQWKNNICSRNIYIILDNDVMLLNRNDNASAPAVLVINGAAIGRIFNSLFNSLTLNNELSILNEVQLSPFSHNFSRYINDFVSSTLIGQGAFGKVYSATNMTDQIRYAIKKIVLKHQIHCKENYQQLISEFRILGTLNHPNVVRYHTAWFEIDTLTANDSDEDCVSSDESKRANTSFSADYCSSNRNNVISFGSLSNGGVSENSVDPSELSSIYSHTDNSNNHQILSRSSSRNNEHYTNIGCVSSPNSVNEGALTPFKNHSPLTDNKLVLYIQMELCDDNLKDWLESRNSLPGCLNEDDKKTTRDLARQLLSGVDYIHRNNIVHRDIKPANLLLVKHGANCDLQLKIGDFGLAKSLRYNEDSSFNEKMSANVGTSFYTAPEVNDPRWRYVAYNNKCDLYSVGIILLELMIKSNTITELCHTISDIKNRIINEDLTVNWPIEAPIIADLISNTVTKRPSAEFILRKTEAFRKSIIENPLYEQNMRLVEENKKLMFGNEKLSKEKEPLSKENEKLRKENEKLRKENEKLLRENEKLRKENEKLIKEN